MKTAQSIEEQDAKRRAMLPLRAAALSVESVGAWKIEREFWRQAEGGPRGRNCEGNLRKRGIFNSHRPFASKAQRPLSSKSSPQRGARTEARMKPRLLAVRGFPRWLSVAADDRSESM